VLEDLIEEHGLDGDEARQALDDSRWSIAALAGNVK
jgi:predicted DsbA family dithiol-disulfide isomerase